MQQRLITLKKASELSGIPYRQILSACNTGEIPYYQISKSRRLVDIAEVISIMRVEINGGDNE